MKTTVIDYITGVGSIEEKGIHNDVPIFVWDEKLINDKEYFEKFVIRLMDMCLMNPALPYECNPMENYEIKNGKVAFDKMRDVYRPHNVVGAAFEKGYDLLQTPINGLINENRKQPIRYTIVRTDDKAIREKIDKASKILTDNLKMQAVSQISSQYNLDPKQLLGELPEETVEDAKNILEQPSDKEIEIRDRVTNVIETTRTKEFLDASIEDRLTVNMQVGKIRTKLGEVEFEKIPLKQYSFIGGDGETLEYAMAASHWSFVSISQVVIEDGMTMESFGTKEDFFQYIKDISAPSSLANFDEHKPFDLYKDTDLAAYFNYGTSIYDMKVLKQDIEYRLVRPICFKVYYKNKPISTEDYKDFVKYGSSWEYFDDIDFVFTEKETGYCVWKPIVETFEARRYGQTKILYNRKKNDTARDLHSYQYSPFSYVMRRTNAPSLVTVAAPINEMYQIAMFKIREASVRSAGKALKSYANFIPQNYSSANEQRYAAQTIGLIEMQINTENAKAVPNDNMTVVDLDESQTIMKWIEIAIRTKSLLENTLGLSPERLAASTSDTATQAGLSYRSSFVLTAHHFWNHDMFVVDVIKAIINTGRKVWSSSKYAMRLSKSQIKLLKELKDDALSAYGIYVNDSSKDSETLSILKSITGKWMDRATDLDSMEAALSIMVSDNPEDAIKKFQFIKDTFNQAMAASEKAAADQAAAAAQAANETNRAAKIDVPMAQIASNEKIALAKLNQAQVKHDDTQRFKEDKEDISRQNELQDMQFGAIQGDGAMPIVPGQGGAVPKM